MEKITVAVDQLESSTAKLIQKHQELKRENMELKNSLETMAGSLAEKEEIISGLIKKNKVLNLAQATMPESRKDIKRTINQMIREVDKCIAQLNK